MKQVGRELGVRYVLEGSVRKAAGRVRITAQLIDALSGAHLWADRFDGSLENVFELQDNGNFLVDRSEYPPPSSRVLTSSGWRPCPDAATRYAQDGAQCHLSSGAWGGSQAPRRNPPQAPM